MSAPDTFAPLPPDNTVSLVVNGFAFAGWEDVRITIGVERLVRDFDIRVTEKYPALPGQIDIKPQDSCVLKVGKDVVLTGYVDRHSISIGPGEHTVRIQGRSKCADLVDCAAGVIDNTGRSIGGQINAQSALAAIQLLIKPFGLTATSLSGPGAAIFPQVVTLGETVFELAERIARWNAFLLYDDPTGNVVLSRVGTTPHASGFEEGVNIERAEAVYSMDERFSTYIGVRLNVSPVMELGGTDGIVLAVVPDPTVLRFRPRVIVSDQLSPTGQPVAALTANWEKSRRYGRSQPVRLTCDSWRDISGELWAPNFVAPLHAPSLKLTSKTWVITEVSFVRSLERGTIAEILLMPPAALSPAPDFQYFLDWDVAKAAQEANANTAGGAAGL